MGGILSTLNNSYTGLQAHQIMTDVTSNNISNANNEFYSRQRVDVAARKPLNMNGQYAVGQGAQVITIERVFDEYVYDRLKDASSNKEYSQRQDEVLTEVSTYYPEIDDVGIFNDLKNFFDSWESLASNGDDPAQKQVLATNTETLSQSVRDLRGRLTDLQSTLYDTTKTLVNEVNNLAEQIANINKQINTYEQELKATKANDLRDRRDQLELKLNDLVSSDVFKKNIQNNSLISTHQADFDEHYTMLIGGAAVVDGVNFHPLKMSEDEDKSGFFDIYYEKQDGSRTYLTNSIDGQSGAIGSLLDLCRGRIENGDTCGGYGKIQGYIDDLDSFAAGIIENVNNIYAYSAQKQMVSQPISNIKNDDYVTESDLHINEGSFDIKMYDTSGNEILSKNITIDRTTQMQDIISQINANTDDNNNMNGLDDFDDFFTASYDETNGVFQIIPKTANNGLMFSISDNGTNFAGATGLSQFLEGTDASDINLASAFRDEPTKINSYAAPAEGNTVVANMMQQLQYDEVNFYSVVDKNQVTTETIEGFFRKAATKVGTDGEQASTLYDTRSSVYTSTKLEFSSISEVNMDEELTNLMKYQAGYSANAKVITTIDQMINTLLGIKQ